MWKVCYTDYITLTISSLQHFMAAYKNGHSLIFEDLLRSPVKPFGWFFPLVPLGDVQPSQSISLKYHQPSKS